MAPEFTPVTPGLVKKLADSMREADALECRALGLSPLEAVSSSVIASTDSVALVREGEVLAIAGLLLETRLLGPRVAQAWVLTSRLVDTYPMSFHRAARAFLRAAALQADVLYNRVDARYVRSVRWLEQLGFVVLPPRPYGPEGQLFHMCAKGGPPWA